MAKAKKLPSGQWRAQAYSHTEYVLDKEGNPLLDKNGKSKQKIIRVSFTADSKKEAELMAAQFAISKAEEKPAKEESITFGIALDEYIKNKESILSPSTICEYKRARKINFKILEPILINEITQEDIQKHINIFSASHSPKSTRDNHGLISAIMRMYRPNFALNTTLPARTRTNLYIPTDNDIIKIMNQVKDTDMEIPVLLAAFGPMRRGEICALKSDSIKDTTVHVHRNMVKNDKKQWVIKQPKSYAGNRFIEFPQFVIDKLAGIEGSITNLNPNMITSRFNHVIIRAGVSHFRFHDLRHYCASILHALGMPDAYIMDRGGWGNDGVLKNVYRHVLEDKQKEVNKKANQYFNNFSMETSHETSHENQKSSI